MLDKMWMAGEVVGLAMLEDEDAVGLQQVVGEDEVGNGGQLFQNIGWVGEDEVELLTAALHETEHIATDGKDGRGTVRSILRATISSAPHIHRWRAGMRLTGHQLGDALLDETVMVAVGLDTHHLPATP